MLDWPFGVSELAGSVRRWLSLSPERLFSDVRSGEKISEHPNPQKNFKICQQ